MQVQLALMYGTDKERLHIVMPIIIQQRNILIVECLQSQRQLNFASLTLKELKGIEQTAFSTMTKCVHIY